MRKPATTSSSRRWPHPEPRTTDQTLIGGRLVIACSFALLASVVLAGCNGSSSSAIVVVRTPTPTATSTSAATATPTPIETSTPTPLPSSTATGTQTATPRPTSTPTATATPTATPTPVVAAGSGAVAVNCETQHAWVAMNNTGAGGADGTVAEVDLSINPATTNPVIAKLDLGIDVPSGVALTPTQLLVVAGDISGGHLYIFNQSDNKPVAG